MRRVVWILAIAASSATALGAIAVGCGVDATGEARTPDTGTPDTTRPEASLPDPSIPIGDSGIDSPVTPDAGEGGTDAALADGQALDGGIGNDSGPGGNGQSMPCGSVASCPIPGAPCCTYPATDGTAYQCVGGACPVGEGPQTASELRCSGASNCPFGTVCCISAIENSQGNQAYRTTCRSDCLGNGAQICDPGAKSTGCLIATPCGSTNITAWGLPASWGTCGDRPP